MAAFRRIIALLVAAIGLSVTPASAQEISTDDFFKMVQLGEVAEVAQALNQQPELAQASDKYGFYAIHMLDYGGFRQKLKLLQQAGADINAQNDEGFGLMHLIVDPEFIPAAVAAGGDVNLLDFEGRTPLMAHLLDGGPDDPFNFIVALLDAGADPAIRDNSGRSVLDYSDAMDDPELTAMLVQAGATR
ncbi:hypothetical protein OS189_05200 [Sulfitobacter sp. F26169L]|uniref:ankyrin repeat domain-containing protein n=1 Tax=Sulfitobacter sp. F26169L TaxID=2996015 RepID=UPI002260BC01|nr:hypothetical protein [Sulfitobacter sp. F26169L]MCX7565730.1 hypothetical protein [Sulfitobacter sp. F26169L]